MVPRLRKGDALAALGILLVLVWTPSYLAADPIAQDLVGGETIEPRDPRPGDRIVQDIVVTDAKGRQYVLEGACIITFRVPSPDESPVPAVLVEERVWPPFDVRVGPVPYENEGLTHRTYLAADGTVAWVTLEQPAHDQWPLLKTGTRPLFPFEEMNTHADHTVHYTASPVHAGMIGITSALGERLRFALSEDASAPDIPSYAAIAAEYKGNVLVGDAGTERYAERMDRLLRKADAGRLLGSDEDVFGWQIPRAWQGTFPSGVHGQGAFWTWFSPAAPIPVGGHGTFTDGPLEGVQIDIVPASIEHGSGPPARTAPGAPWRIERHPPISDVEDPYHRLEERQGPRIQVDRLEEDPTPLYRGYTVARLKELLVESDPPASIRAALADSARIVGYSWSLSPPHLVDTTTGTPLPPLVTEPPTTTTEWASEWRLLLAAPARAPLVVDLMVRERADGEWSASSTDACAAGTAPCGSAPLRPVDLEREVAAPAAVLAAARSLHPAMSYDGLPGRFTFDPTYLERLDRATDSVSSRSYAHEEVDCVRNAWVDGSALHIEGALVPGGVACWDDEHGPEGTSLRQAGTVDLSDGHLMGLMTIDETAGAPPPGTTAASSPASGVTILDVPATTLAAGGLVLVVVSFGLRFMTWIKLGGHLPVVAVLYAKIAKGQVLDHARRSEIHDAIRADPGVTARELADRTGYAWGVVIHHIATLERNALVTSITAGNRRSYFVTGERDAASRRLFAAERNPDDRDLLTALRDEPGATLSELAERLGRKPTSVSRSGKRLVALGVVRKERDGMRVRYHPTAMIPGEP